MFGNKNSNDECYKVNKHSNVTSIVHALIVSSLSYNSNRNVL